MDSEQSGLALLSFLLFSLDMFREEPVSNRAGRIEQQTKGKFPIYLLAVLLVCSVIINVLLARKLEHLRYVEATLRAEGTLQPDTVVPVIEAKGLDGNTVSFPYGDSELPLVIYVLSPTCAWCKKNESNVEALAKSVDDKYRFIALSLSPDGLKEYAESQRIAFPLYSHLSDKTISAYKLGATPQTIVVSSQGKVLKNWTGAYIDNVKQEVESYFNVRLPGLVQARE